MKKELSIKNKRALLIAAVAIGAIGIVGTIAYNMDAVNFANLFHIQNSQEIYTETFESPNNWQPCEEIPKTATATNKNDTPRYVRMKIDEYWRVKNSQTSADDHTTSDLSLTWTDGNGTHSYAIINTQNDSAWELKSDGYYYHKTPLAKDQTTLSLLRSVTLNCDAKLVENGTVTSTATGAEGESIPTAYADATYHVYVTMEMSDVEWPEPEDPMALMTVIKRDVNPDNTQIDFRKFAQKSDDPVIANGNGVNKATENGQTVYYYRGQIDDNHVIWGNACWRILRTTYTGGIKMIYDGPPSYKFDNQGHFTNGVCRNSTNTISGSYSSFSNSQRLAGIGYMYGDDVRTIDEGPAEERYYSNGISRDENGYSLNITPGNYFYGRADNDIHSIIDNDFYYYCEDTDGGGSGEEGSRICWKAVGSSTAAYMTGWHGGLIDDGQNTRSIWSIPVTGYDNIGELKEAVFANNTPSAAKTTLEAFANSLTEADMEDAIFCNDRSIYSGSLADINPRFEVTTDYWGSSIVTTLFGAYRRNSMDYDNNYHPSLDCPNKRDAFTKDDTTNGNGALSRSIGLVTADEVTMSGVPYKSYGMSFDSNICYTTFIYGSTTSGIITMTPSYLSDMAQPQLYYAACWQQPVSYSASNLRPVVSLKPGTKFKMGDGTADNVYIINTPFNF